jgi:hypothetical protein
MQVPSTAAVTPCTLGFILFAILLLLLLHLGRLLPVFLSEHDYKPFALASSFPPSYFIMTTADGTKASLHAPHVVLDPMHNDKTHHVAHHH